VVYAHLAWRRVGLEVDEVGDGDGDGDGDLLIESYCNQLHPPTLLLVPLIVPVTLQGVSF